MQRTEERVFTDAEGDITVKSTQHAALPAFRLMGRLGKLLTPALSQFKGVKFKSDVSSLAPVLAALFERLDPAESDSLAIQVLCNTLVVAGGKAVTLTSADAINQVFSGRLLSMFKVMAFAVEVNYKDFFLGLPSGVAEPKAATDPASP